MLQHSTNAKRALVYRNPNGGRTWVFLPVGLLEQACFDGRKLVEIEAAGRSKIW